ncbi:MAG: metallophosphoesterase [Acetatifactor sp.]|nr:metallophosphoesterase [Acetatifactor sp.]
MRGRYLYTVGVVLLGGVLLLGAFGGNTGDKIKRIAGVGKFKPASVEEVLVTIPGMQGEKKLLYLSDLHIIVESNQIAAEKVDEVRGRIGWSSYNGMSAAEAWPKWVKYVNHAKPDAVLLGGDMVDFGSEANVACLKKSLNKMEYPWMYIRADHDEEPYYLDKENVSYEMTKGYQDSIVPNDEVMSIEYEDFLVVGWNNSTSALSENALEEMRRLFSAGKPIILLTHVPVKSLLDCSLAQRSRDAWGDRELIWGEDCYYSDERAMQFLDMIYAEDSPVCEILCGHLHFTWDGQVTETVHQHVFGPAMEGCVGVITVSGE